MTNFVKLTHDRLDVGAVSNLVTSNTTGAMSLFVGTTRDHFNGKKVVRLEYEAYESMAEKKMVELCHDLRKKWKLHHVAIYHRLGVVEPSQASVIIAITSEHRKESLEAVQFAIDSLKASVPIWKKEVYEDGTEWKANSECPWSSKVVQQSQKVDPSFVQITASEEEVEARIDAFIARKRTEIDSANIQEFCHRPVDEEEPEFSCARTDSIVIRRTGGSSHLRTSAVVNLFGPTTSSQPANQAGVKKEGTDIPSSLEERLVQLEDHLFGVNRPVPKDVYARIKALEEKVLFLEGVSPEYFNPQSKMKKELATSSAKRSRENVDEVMTSLTQINSRIQELRSTLASKPDPTKK